MTRDEIAALLAYAARLDPRTAPRDTTDAADRLDQWTELLADVPATTPTGWDAARTVRDHITNSPYPILPADIARRWVDVRRAALQRHTDPTPAADPDRPDAYRAALAADRAAVATGRRVPLDSRSLTGGPHPTVAAAIANTGRQLPAAPPPDLRQRLGLRPRRPELAVACPKCHATPGRPCQRPSGHDMRDTHPSRRDTHGATT